MEDEFGEINTKEERDYFFDIVNNLKEFMGTVKENDFNAYLEFCYELRKIID